MGLSILVLTDRSSRCGCATGGYGALRSGPLTGSDAPGAGATERRPVPYAPVPVYVMMLT